MTRISQSLSVRRPPLADVTQQARISPKASAPAGEGGAATNFRDD